MTKNEAKLFFPLEKEEDIDAAWEIVFFKQKQYFLTHTPIPNVWYSKIRRLQKQYKAYLILSNQMVPAVYEEEIADVHPIFNPKFIEAFHLFHQYRNQHKLAVLNATDLHSLTIAVKSWLVTEKQYAQYWVYPESSTNDLKVVQSKEPDPMDWLNSLERIQAYLSSQNINILKENYNILPEDVRKEVKRLTLLANN